MQYTVYHLAKRQPIGSPRNFSIHLQTREISHALGVTFRGSQSKEFHVMHTSKRTFGRVRIKVLKIIPGVFCRVVYGAVFPIGSVWFGAVNAP